MYLNYVNSKLSIDKYPKALTSYDIENVEDAITNKICELDFYCALDENNWNEAWNIFENWRIDDFFNGVEKVL